MKLILTFLLGAVMAAFAQLPPSMVPRRPTAPVPALPTAQLVELELVVEQVGAKGALVRPMVHEPIHSGLSSSGLGGAVAVRSVPGSKQAFVKGLKAVTEQQRCTILAYRDGIYAEEGRSLEQWVFVRMAPKS